MKEKTQGRLRMERNSWSHDFTVIILIYYIILTPIYYWLIHISVIIDFSLTEL